jgi:hypothetical protein
VVVEPPPQPRANTITHKILITPTERRDSDFHRAFPKFFEFLQTDPHLLLTQSHKKIVPIVPHSQVKAARTMNLLNPCTG